ncbi:MAG: hypothetical protein D6E12_05780 [Desulfovibrio sp.]|nr:MAG: hypothetical protein D6E12_05780 [Desulfovibrio sp.]
MKTRCIFALVLVSALLMCVSGCGGEEEAETSPSPESSSPADAVRGFYAALYNNDTQTVEDVQNLTQHIVDEFFYTTSEEELNTLMVGLPLIIDRTSVYGGATVEFQDVEYEIISQTPDTARVRMTGRAISTLPDGLVQDRDLDKTYQLVNVEGKWKMRSLE